MGNERIQEDTSASIMLFTEAGELNEKLSKMLTEYRQQLDRLVSQKQNINDLISDRESLISMLENMRNTVDNYVPKDAAADTLERDAYKQAINKH